eukprot:1322779-Pyramimonas_sp.AAC.1
MMEPTALLAVPSSKQVSTRDVHVAAARREPGHRLLDPRHRFEVHGPSLLRIVECVTGQPIPCAHERDFGGRAMLAVAGVDGPSFDRRMHAKSWFAVPLVGAPRGVILLVPDGFLTHLR